MDLDVSIDGITFGTPLNKVNVPPELRVKRPSGVPAFDKALGGLGMTPSAVTLFTGTAGAGKTTLLLQVGSAYAEQGCIVVYNTAEESAFQLRMTYDRLNPKGSPLVGQISRTPDLLAQCDAIRAKHPTRPFILIQDSLQTLDDGHFKTGRRTSATALRCMEQITNWTKARLPGAPDESAFPNSIVIGQVTKAGKMAGSNELMHMIDARLHFSIDDNPKSEWFDHRKMDTFKNRFGGAGAISYLKMTESGLKMVGEIINDYED